jgi:hypothetical protein
VFPNGKLMVKVRAPTAGASGSAEVEFVWTKAGPALPAVTGLNDFAPKSDPNAPASASPAPIVWQVSMAELARGAGVPASVRPNLPGFWRVRVRAVSGAAPGPWSEAVSFHLGGFMGIEPDHAALNPRVPAPGVSTKPSQMPAPAVAPTAPHSIRDWKQAPSTFNR